MGLQGQRNGGIGLPGIERCPTEKPERVRDHAGIALSAMHRKALLEYASGHLTVALIERQRSEHGLRLRAVGGRAGAERKQPLQPLAYLLLEAPQLRVAPERRADPETDVRLAGIHRPGERGADVVSLCVETLEPFALLWAEQARLGLLGQRDVVVGVSTPYGIAVAASRQTIECVLADGLEHSQARFVAACSFCREEVVLQEGLDRLQDVEAGLLRDDARRRPA